MIVGLVGDLEGEASAAVACVRHLGARGVRLAYQLGDLRFGMGPDPDGYLVEETPDGYRWTCRADGRTAGPFASREEAVASAEADRTA